MIENEPRVDIKEARIATHLRKIDPVLVPLAGKLAQPPYKDLSTPEAFHLGTETLEAKDLVAVHLTNTFPEDGVIHPTNYYDPKILRFTTHFSINAVAPEIWTGWNWKQKKYAILIPFDKLQGRILTFNPADTFVLEDINLPDGTVILKDKTDTNTVQKAGMAKVIDVDYSQEGEIINGFHRAVYEQMVSMGYFPQAVGERGDYYGWNLGLPYGGEIRGRDILEKFCERIGLEFAKGNPHESHWAGKLEEISEGLEFAREDNDEGGFHQTVDTANRLFLSEDSQFGNQVPRKYKEALIELIKDYQQTFDTEVELPDLPPDEAIKKARAKVVDLSQDKEHLLHSTSLEMLPSILEDGIISIMFAERRLNYHELPSQFDPVAQYSMDVQDLRSGRNQLMGSDLISVYDLRTRPPGAETILDILNGRKFPTGVISLLISPSVATRRVRGRPIFQGESFLRRRVAPRDIDGVVIRSNYFERSLSDLEQGILFQPDFGMGGSDEYESIRQRFMAKHLHDPKLHDLFERALNNKSEMEKAYTDFMNLFGFMQQNPYRLERHFDQWPLPNALFDFSGGMNFDKRTNRMRVGIGKERKDDLTNLELYIKNFKEEVAGLKEEKDSVKFGDLVRIFGMGTGIVPEKPPEKQPTRRGGLLGLFGSPLPQPPQEPHPLEKEAPVDEIIGLMEKILDTRRTRLEQNPIVWRRYIETVAGKKIDNATLGDFVLGLCKQTGLPLYNEKGEVLWPK